jgi:hypothetical protein
MNFKLMHRVSAFIVFVASTIILLMTVAPTLSFWDCGEFITSAVTLGVPHPPGAPFFQLVGRIFSLLPTSGDLGFRMNLLSTLSSSISVLFAYLIIMRLLRLLTGDPTTKARAVTMILSAMTGAFILAFSDTFWFNASESEVYAIGMFFISVVVWIGLEWYSHAGVFDSERSLLLIAYLVGLSIGVHLLSLLAILFVFVLFFLRDRRPEDMRVKNWFIFLLVAAVGFFLIYPGVVKFVPEMLSKSFGKWFILLVFIFLVSVVTSRKMHAQLRMAALSILLVTLGYSTYTLVLIRANDAPAMNENNPHDLKTLYSYLNREQYGSYPLLKGPNYDNRTQTIDPKVQKYFPRRWNPEFVSEYEKYSSDLEFFLSFQFGHHFMRYFLWNFVGRAGDIQDAPISFIGSQGDWSESAGYPNRYYAIPLLLGLIGMVWNFRKDWKTGTAMAVLFFMMGAGLVIYFNMAAQVRERDYFYVGSFFAFAIWAGLGTYGIYDLLREKLNNNEAVGLGIAAVMFVIAPGNMLKENYQTHTRHLNYVAFDYAYNLLQSCDQDAIMFTGGDNDTFPVWFLQYAAGIRRDVRIVNLSLVNTPWYAEQLKNDRPYGAKAVELSFSDDDLNGMEPQAWERQEISIPVEPSSFPMNSLTEVPLVKATAEMPKTLDFVVNSTFTDQRGAKGIRVQDMLIIDILKNNISKRPIYFALSTSPTDRIGLEEHLVVEGLAARVTPYKFPQRGDRYYASMNIPVTQRHLMETRSVPDSNRAFGFMFRELNNPAINLDEASTKMIMSFRYLYMGLSQVVYQDLNDRAQASSVIDQMNKAMPPAYHEMDKMMETDLSTLFFIMGDTARFLKIANNLETYYLAELEKDPSGQSTSRSPYSVLLNIYELTGKYQKGVDIMKRYQKLYPNDRSIDAQIQSWEAKARGGTPPPAVAVDTGQK